MNERSLLATLAASLAFFCAHAPAQQAPSAADSSRFDGLERVAFSSLRPGNWDIFYFRSPGVEPRRLTNHPGLDYDATFSPDGRFVVFTSERRGNPDLFVIDLDRDGEPRLLIDSPALTARRSISTRRARESCRVRRRARFSARRAAFGSGR